MATVYLHIGMPKTGTSFIQEFLYANNEIIQKQGYVFPDFAARYEMVRKERNAHFIIAKDDGSFEETYSKGINKIKSLTEKFDNIILSDATCWKRENHIKRFVEDMKLLDIQVKIVAYLRRQDLYVQSMWAQKIKEGAKRKFKEHIKYEEIAMRYYERCSTFSGIVGKENFILGVYEKGQLGGIKNDLLTDFLEKVGLKYDDEFINTDVIVNSSLNGIYVEVKRMLNKYPEFKSSVGFVTSSLREISNEEKDNTSYSSNRWFSFEEQMNMLSEYAEENEKVAREFLGRKDGVLFREEIIDNKCETIKYKKEEYVDVCAKILLKREKKIKEQKMSIEKLKNKNEELTEELIMYKNRSSKQNQKIVDLNLEIKRLNNAINRYKSNSIISKIFGRLRKNTNNDKI